VLCAAYAILAIAPIVQLVRIHIRAPEAGWGIQKLFLLFCTGGALIRIVLFGILVLLRLRVGNFFLDEDDAPTFIILSNVPRIVFFTTFSLLILLWAEIIHRVRYHQSRSFVGKRNVFIGLNIFIYTIQGLFWFFIFYQPSEVKTMSLPIIENLFFAVLSVTIAILFLIYGGRLFFMLKNFPYDSPDLANKLFEVGSVTSVCTTCFLIRGSLLFLTSFMQSVQLNAYVLLSYCLTTEIIPAILVLGILSKLPSQPSKHNSTTDSKFPSSADGSYCGSILSQAEETENLQYRGEEHHENIKI